jgi:hypothetical protein
MSERSLTLETKLDFLGKIIVHICFRLKIKIMNMIFVFFFFPFFIFSPFSLILLFSLQYNNSASTIRKTMTDDEDERGE